MIYAVNKRTKEHRISGQGAAWDSDWTIMQADADGWIDWSGRDECPLPENMPYEWRFVGDARFCEGTHPELLDWSKVAVYRPILEPQAEQSKEWNGEGLPPVGTVCEYAANDDEDEYPRWLDGDELEVLAHRVTDSDENVAVLWNVRDTTACARMMRHKGKALLRPIRTTRERWIEAASEHFCDDDAAETMRRIYDAGLASLRHIR